MSGAMETMVRATAGGGEGRCPRKDNGSQHLWDAVLFSPLNPTAKAMVIRTQAAGAGFQVICMGYLMDSPRQLMRYRCYDLSPPSR